MKCDKCGAANAFLCNAPGGLFYVTCTDCGAQYWPDLTKPDPAPPMSALHAAAIAKAKGTV